MHNSIYSMDFPFIWDEIVHLLVILWLTQITCLFCQQLVFCSYWALLPISILPVCFQLIVHLFHLVVLTRITASYYRSPHSQTNTLEGTHILCAYAVVCTQTHECMRTHGPEKKHAHAAAELPYRFHNFSFDLENSKACLRMINYLLHV